VKKMFCPQCGSEAPANQQYCRKCGANLKMIGKAVALSESIARSDRGPLPKIKEMIKTFKLEHVTDDVSRALEQMNQEIVRGITSAKTAKQLARKEKEERRRENHIVRGLVSLFSGSALMIVLYYLARVMVLKIPAEDLAKIPFELEPVVRMLWIVGLLPAMTGMGRIIAGLLVRPRRAELEHRQPVASEQPIESGASRAVPLSVPSTAALPPNSVTENTTEFFNHTRKQQR
jgi:hypothetical protein